jgi:DnaJ-class molecular chaperone
MRAFRRVARIVHPDKCRHALAKEAFQKLLLSSKSLKSNNGSSIYSSYVIQIINLFATNIIRKQQSAKGSETSGYFGMAAK